MARRKPLYPVPEAITRPDLTGPYEIEDGYSSSVDLAKGRMVVSTGGPCRDCGQDHARASRIHETGHAAFTPKDWAARARRTKDKLPVELVNACEDARIYARRAASRLAMSPPQLCEVEDEPYQIVRQAIRSGNLLHLAATVAAAYQSGDEAAIDRAVERVASELAAKADPLEQLKGTQVATMCGSVKYMVKWHMSYHYNPTFRQSLALARSLIDVVNNTASEYASRAAEISEQLRHDAETRIRKYGGKTPPKQPANVKFGEMLIVKLPLPNRAKAGFDRKWTAREEGDVPVRFDRWTIDRRVFRARKKTKGAALLVDVSGSMAWTADDLARVLNEVPAATIALYSGAGPSGKLVIVARKGRAASMTAAHRYMMGGNVIDGPALQWLADQPESVKLWMSDGGITGVGDGWSGEGGEAYCGKILRKGHIMQVRNVGKVMDVLKGKQPFVPSKRVGNGY